MVKQKFSKSQVRMGRLEGNGPVLKTLETAYNITVADRYDVLP
jgi:hypothetical protein